MRVNHFLRKLYSLFDFGGSKEVDQTPGGFPFVFVIALFPILLGLILLLYFIFYH